jgi:hypothetical protein
MTRKRNLSTKFLLALRHLGMLCKKPVPVKPVIKISHTVLPDGYISPIDSARHVWLENKKSGIKNCEFDIDAGRCERCGLTVDGFSRGECTKRKVKK